MPPRAVYRLFFFFFFLRLVFVLFSRACRPNGHDQLGLSTSSTYMIWGPVLAALDGVYVI